MAALDFGMALARGMLPTSAKAQQDLLKQAGGRNIFKSEDWWNQAVDKQIKEGFETTRQETQYKTAPTYFGSMMIDPGGFVAAGPDRFGVTQAPSNLVLDAPSMLGGRPVTRTATVTETKDFTAAELSDIEASAKAGAQRAKRQTAQATAAQKRTRRGTAGLAAKAMKVGDKPVTGLPELGTGGLGIGATTLGKGLVV